MKRTKFKNKWKGKILKTIAEDKAERQRQKDLPEEKAQRKKHFDKVYGKTIKKRFKTMDEVNTHRFFGFPVLEWKRDRLNELAVYPVLCSMADFERVEWFQISQKNLAMFAGYSQNTLTTIRNSLEGLCHSFYVVSPSKKFLLERKFKRQNNQRYYVYNVYFYRKRDLSAKDKPWYFPFHTWIIETGVWAKLSKRAKAFYIALRSNVDHWKAWQWDYVREMADKYDLPAKELIQTEFSEREWEICSKNEKQLCEFINISVSGIKRNIKELEQVGLLEVIKLDGELLWKTWLKPNRKSNKIIG